MDQTNEWCTLDYILCIIEIFRVRAGNVLANSLIKIIME